MGEGKSCSIPSQAFRNTLQAAAAKPQRRGGIATAGSLWSQLSLVPESSPRVRDLGWHSGTQVFTKKINHGL